MSESTSQQTGARARFEPQRTQEVERPAGTDTYPARGEARVYYPKILDRGRMQPPPDKAVGRATVQQPWERDMELIKTIGRTLTAWERRALDSGDVTPEQIIQTEQMRSQRLGVYSKHPVDPTEVV